jgi:serine/threonine protein kinase
LIHCSDDFLFFCSAAYELLQIDSYIVLIYEYFDGISLRELLKEKRSPDLHSHHIDIPDISLTRSSLSTISPLQTHRRIVNTNTSVIFSLQKFLPLSIQLSLTLAQIHKENIIHKDISCGNILYNEHTGKK